MNNTASPICWTIAGSDSGGGAGIQADLKTFNALGVHGCSVITAITAQNTSNIDRTALTAADLVEAQIRCLAKDLPPNAIKIGMVGMMGNILAMNRYLKNCNVPVVCDPIIMSSSGTRLLDPSALETMKNKLLNQVWLVTPNVAEAELLSGLTGLTTERFPEAAQRILEYGCSSVLIKGGHSDDVLCHDLWTDGDTMIWMNSKRVETQNNHGTGCVLSSAITASLARGEDAGEALLTGKSFVHQALRKSVNVGEGPGPLGIEPWPQSPLDLPTVTATIEEAKENYTFPSLRPAKFKLYPIVNDVTWIERLLKTGVELIQLRLKSRDNANREEEVKKAIELGRQYDAMVIINDDWELAIKYGAYGVHLGQDDLYTADMHAISNAGLRLGVSTHSLYEVARAQAFSPSYIAIGTINRTTSKEMDYPPLGITRLAELRSLIDVPVVAIGGISLENARDCFSSGADYCAVISDITQSPDPEARIATWAHEFSNLSTPRSAPVA